MDSFIVILKSFILLMLNEYKSLLTFVKTYYMLEGKLKMIHLHLTCYINS